MAAALIAVLLSLAGAGRRAQASGPVLATTAAAYVAPGTSAAIVADRSEPALVVARAQKHRPVLASDDVTLPASGRPSAVLLPFPAVRVNRTAVATPLASAATPRAPPV